MHTLLFVKWRKREGKLRNMTIVWVQTNLLSWQEHKGVHKCLTKLLCNHTQQGHVHSCGCRITCVSVVENTDACILTALKKIYG